MGDAVATTTGGRARRTRNARGTGGRLRVDLVAAADRLLATGGEEALTLRAAAREVGAAPQSVYLHFADREELLWAVLTERFAGLRAVIEEAGIRPVGPSGDEGGDQPSDPLDVLRARCLALCRYGLEDPGRYRLLLVREAPRRHEVALDDLPGAVMFRMLQSDVRAVLTASAAGGDTAGGDAAGGDAAGADSDPVHRAFVVTTDLLATLHGAILLRTSMPSFPWPAMEDLVGRALAALPA